MFSLIIIFLVSLMLTPNVQGFNPFDPSPSSVDVLTTDWTTFWQRFNQHTQWDLEVNSGTGWTSVKSYLQIIRDYVEPNHCKITLIFDAYRSGDYRLTLGIDKALRRYVHKNGEYNYTLEYGEYTVVFDWSDVLAIPNLQISHGVKDIMGERWFWFRLRRDNVPQGAHLEIDPSIVATGQVDAISYPNQRKSFYANSRYWVFYSTGSALVWKTSEDGYTWSDATILRTGTSGTHFSIWFNGTYIHYAYTSGSVGEDLLYRRGTPNSDGTITWTTTEQTAFNTPSGNQTYRPFVCVDSDGCPWIGYQRSGESLQNLPYVIKSDLSNGSWSTASGFPYKLTTVSTSWFVSVVPLTSQKTYVLYSYSTATIKGKLWNGSAWGSEETTTSGTFVGESYSVVNEGDHIHLVFLKKTTYDIVYVKRTYGSGWGTESNIAVSTSGSSYPVITIDGSDLYVFWGADDVVYYRQFISGSWDSSSTSWRTETNLIENTLASYYDAQNNRIAVCWLQQVTAQPHNLRHHLHLLGKESVGSFEIFSDGAITNANWDSINNILSFETTGDVYVYIADEGRPLHVEVDNEIHTDWIFSQEDLLVFLNDVSGLVELIWTPDVEDTGTDTTTEPPIEDEEDYVAPIQRLPMLGLYIVVGGIAIFGVSAIWRKLSRPSHRGKPRGVRSRSTPRKRVPHKPKQSKRSGRFIK